MPGSKGDNGLNGAPGNGGKDGLPGRRGNDVSGTEKSNLQFHSLELCDQLFTFNYYMMILFTFVT